MKALVVYEGNTEKVAQAICSGLKQSGLADVECKAVGNIASGPSEGRVLGHRRTVDRIPGRTEDQGLLRKSVSSGSKANAVLFDTRMAGSTTGMVDKLAAIVKSDNMKVASSTYFSLGPSKALMDGEENAGRGLRKEPRQHDEVNHVGLGRWGPGRPLLSIYSR